MDHVFSGAALLITSLWVGLGVVMATRIPNRYGWPIAAILIWNALLMVAADLRAYQ